MAWWVCTSCTASRPVGLGTCPQCGASGHRFDYEIEEDAMPKVARDNDPTDPEAGPRASYDGHVDLGPEGQHTPEWVSADHVLEHDAVAGDDRAAAERAAARPEPAEGDVQEVRPSYTEAPVERVVEPDKVKASDAHRADADQEQSSDTGGEVAGGGKAEGGEKSTTSRRRERADRKDS